MSACSDIYFAAANAARLDGDDALADACMRAATRAALRAADADHAALYPAGCRVGISQMCEACASRLHGVASPAFPDEPPRACCGEFETGSGMHSGDDCEVDEPAVGDVVRADSAPLAETTHCCIVCGCGAVDGNFGRCCGCGQRWVQVSREEFARLRADSDRSPTRPSDFPVRS